MKKLKYTITASLDENLYDYMIYRAAKSGRRLSKELREVIRTAARNETVSRSAEKYNTTDQKFVGETYVYMLVNHIQELESLLEEWRSTPFSKWRNWVGDYDERVDATLSRRP